MKGCPSEEMLLRLAENELGGHETSFVNEHVRSCEKCRKLLAEYRELSHMLAKDRISEPSQAEWQYLMVTMRAKLRGGTRVWDKPRTTGRPGRRPQVLPAWTRVTAVAAAAVVSLVILWKAGVVDVGRLADGIGVTGKHGERAAGRVDGYGVSEKTSPFGAERPAGSAVTPSEKVASDEDGLFLSDEILLAADSTSLNLADLTKDELYELGELSTSVSAPRDYDLLLVDLTQEEEAQLLSEMEKSFSM